MAEPDCGPVAAPRRAAYLCLGYVSVGLGVAGAALPLLPTTPFLLLAAWAFGRSSPRLRAWIEDHPRFGPPLRHWRERRAIPRRAKLAAIIALCVSWGTTTAVVGGLVAPLLSGLFMLGVAAFILSRPAPETP